MLAGMPEDQINQVFDTLFAAVRKTSQPGPDLSGVPAHARPQIVRDEPKAPTADELKAMFDKDSDTFDPAAAIKRIVDANYGGIVADISRNANAGLKAELRNTLPDFKDYEKDVDELVAQMPAGSVNQTTYAQAYFTVKGFKQTQKEYQERSKPPTTVPPSPARIETDDIKMSAEDVEVAKVMFRGSADPVAEYKKAAKQMETQHMRVPGDAKK